MVLKKKIEDGGTEEKTGDDGTEEKGQEVVPLKKR